MRPDPSQPSLKQTNLSPPTQPPPTPSFSPTTTSVGTSAGGRPFYGLEVSDKPNQSATSQSADDEREPSAVFIGNMHGDEISGR